MPKATAAMSSHKRRHNPLEDDLVSTGVLKNREGKPSKRAAKTGAAEQTYVDAKASRKILAMSRDLIDEEELQSAASNRASGPSAFDFDQARLGPDSDHEEDFVNEEAWGDDEDVVEEIEVDAADLETFNQFVTPTLNDDPLLTHGWDGKPADGTEEQGQSTNLADLIMAKIAEQEAMRGGRQEELINPIEEDYELPPKVVEVFTKYVLGWDSHVDRGWGANIPPGLVSFLPGTSLGRCQNPSKSCHKFRTGRISCRLHGQNHGGYTLPWPCGVHADWRPGRTPNACYAATRIFVSAKPLVVQRFMEMVILEHVREDIYENKKLNVHLFNCLKRGLYKPAGFFKGQCLQPNRARVVLTSRLQASCSRWLHLVSEPF